ncbi:hypothetical protein ACHAWF_012823, partial [Thalassiosira exigua]
SKSQEARQELAASWKLEQQRDDGKIDDHLLIMASKGDDWPGRAISASGTFASAASSGSNTSASSSRRSRRSVRRSASGRIFESVRTSLTSSSPSHESNSADDVVSARASSSVEDENSYRAPRAVDRRAGTKSESSKRSQSISLSPKVSRKNPVSGLHRQQSRRDEEKGESWRGETAEDEEEAQWEVGKTASMLLRAEDEDVTLLEMEAQRELDEAEAMLRRAEEEATVWEVDEEEKEEEKQEEEGQRAQAQVQEHQRQQRQQRRHKQRPKQSLKQKMKQKQRSWRKLPQPDEVRPTEKSNRAEAATTREVMEGIVMPMLSTACSPQPPFMPQGQNRSNGPHHPSRSHSLSIQELKGLPRVQKDLPTTKSENSTPQEGSWVSFFFSEEDKVVTDDDDETSLGSTMSNDPFEGKIPENSRFRAFQRSSSITFDSLRKKLPVHDDDESTCANSVVERKRQRGKKAVRGSLVGAFITFLKALFGIGMLSNPAVLGEVGLVLGSVCHIVIVLSCAFGCYLILGARQVAKVEVTAKHRKNMEKWRENCMAMAEKGTRAAQWSQRRPQSSDGGPESSRTPPRRNSKLVRQSSKTSDPLDVSHNSRYSSRGSRSPRGSNKSPGRTVSKSSDEYHRFSDQIHHNFMMQTQESLPEKPKKVRLVTYPDIIKYHCGKGAASCITILVIALHIMFASGMMNLAVENLCYVLGWESLGLGNSEAYEGQDRALQSSGDGDKSGSGEWTGPDLLGRFAMVSLLFPIIQGLLQIPSLTELATISGTGLTIYAVGCIGPMMYSALVLTDGHPFRDHPDDMWTTKWSGIPTYVATTIYCIEGINLALPTVVGIEGAQRAGGVAPVHEPSIVSGASRRHSLRQDISVFVVVGAVFLYGMITLFISWIGLAGGLGGGSGTMHGEDGCRNVTYCLNSSAARYVYMLSLGVALVLTLPVILYPSTQLLEVWLDEVNERQDQEERERNNNSTPTVLPRPSLFGQKSLLPDDESVYTAADTLKSRTLGIQHSEVKRHERSASTGAFEYVAPRPYSSPSMEMLPGMSQRDKASVVKQIDPTYTKMKSKRKLKYWKVRTILAIAICVIGTLEGVFPMIVAAAGVLRGVGLSIVGLIVPPLLFMSAVDGNFTVSMAISMALSIGLGLFNMILVLRLHL